MSECSLTEFCEQNDVVDDKCLTYKAYQRGREDMAKYLADYLSENAYCELGENKILEIARRIDEGGAEE